VAETLTRPKRSRRHKAPDPRERELKRLKLSICDDTGFRLHLATYDQPKRRDELIERVIRESEAEKVQVTQLDLTQSGSETNLVGLLRTHVAGTHLPSGWRQAVMVTGIEQRLDYAGGPEGFAFLHQANLLRDALPEAAPVPVVLWLSRMASAVLPAEAPDLWHWRAANFDFTGDEAPRLELLRELTTYQQENEGGLSIEQRRARAQIFEDLLAELEREGPPKSRRQAVERASLLMDVGIESQHLQLPAESLPHVERALAVYRELEFRPGEALALRLLGRAWQQLGELRRAIELYEQCLTIEREIDDRREESATLRSLGRAWADLGDERLAIDHFEQALAIEREFGDRRGVGVTLRDLGIAYSRLGEMQRAIGYFERALVTAREIRDWREEWLTLGRLGTAYAGLGEPQRTVEYYQEALDIARRVRSKEAEGLILSVLGAAYYVLGEPQRAMEAVQEALVLAEETGQAQLADWARSRLVDWDTDSLEN
jgi:tetratricopeptide (TPR) repeat protein